MTMEITALCLGTEADNYRLKITLKPEDFAAAEFSGNFFEKNFKKLSQKQGFMSYNI